MTSEGCVCACALLIAGCVPGGEPATSSQASALVGVSDSIAWDPGKDCGGAPCDGNHIWPPGLGITSVQVLFRSAPDRLNHTVPTFLAFVVWNDAVVGRIYRVDVGAPGADLREKISNVFATRTWNLVDTEAGSAGTAAGGPAPPPHPNIDGDLHFSAPYLNAVKASAAAIHQATQTFLATPEQTGVAATAASPATPGPGAVP